MILWIPCKPYSSIWAVFQLHESYTLFSFLLKYLRSKKDLCHSGSKSLIKSFIQRPACWRKVRENKLSHRVLFKLSDPFQHALPASLFVCVWGLGWGGREGGEKKFLMAESPWNNWHLSKAASPQPPALLRGHRRLPICSAHTHTHTHCTTQATKWLSNNFAHKCHSTPSLAPWAFSSPPPPRALPPNELDRFQCLKAHLTTSFCLEILSLDLILSTLPCQEEEDAEGFWGSCNELKSSTSPSRRALPTLQQPLCYCGAPEGESVPFMGPHRMASLLLLYTFLPLKISLLALRSQNSALCLAGTVFWW